jgi:hypothetical protein
MVHAGDNDGITPATCPEQFHLGDTPFATSTSTYGGGLTLATFAYSGAQGRWVGPWQGQLAVTHAGASLTCMRLTHLLSSE